MKSRSFKCSLDTAKRSFYHAANAIFCKIGLRASEDVILELIRTKCLSAALYGLELEAYHCCIRAWFCLFVYCLFTVFAVTSAVMNKVEYI